MKIRKAEPIESKVKLRQAQELLQRPPAFQETRTIGAEQNAERRAARALIGDRASPITKPLRIYPGTPALVEPINKAMMTTGEDLRVIADSTSILEDELAEIYNQARTKELDLFGQIKTLRNKIVTVSLYKEGLVNNKYIVYSFDDATDLQEGTLTIDEEAGHLTLPVTANKSIQPSRVTPLGNGRPGNNLDRSRGLHNNVQTMIDGDTQTWFEYEKVSSNRQAELNLTLKLELEIPAIINRLTITPVNFGTNKWVSIEDIQVERGGIIESLKSEILSGTSETALRLAPSTSRFAGVGIFNFYPREVSAVYIKLTQNESYPILNGRFFRTAIGIKEIELHQIEFSKEGVFTLSQKPFINPVLGIGIKKAVALGLPSDYTLSLEVKVNDDPEWSPIQFLTDSELAEEVVVGRQISSVQLRGKCKRSDSLSPRVDPQTKKFVKSQLKEASGGGVQLDAPPLSFLEVIETGLGAVGQSAPPLFLGRASGLPGVNQTFTTPVEFDPLWAFVEVNGRRWNFVSSLGDEDYEGVLYFPERRSGQIQFGDGTVGKLPPSGAEIYLRLYPEERAVFTETAQGFSAELEFQSDKVKELTKVYYRDFNEREAQARLGPGGRIFSINESHQSISLTRLEVDGEELDLESEIEFQNGAVEFAELAPEAGPYFSIDRRRNKIYLSSELANDASDAIAEYKYRLRQLLPPQAWSFSNTENKIIINSPLFTVRSSEKTIVNQTQGRVLKLVGNSWLGEDYSLIKKSIVPVNLNGVIGISRTLENELSFIDGATEFNEILIAGLSLLGFYSVDYRNAKIHLPPQEGIDEADRGFLPGKILFQYVGTEIEYGIGKKLQRGTDYDVTDNRINLNPSYLIAAQEAGRRTRVHLRYDMNNAQQSEGADVSRFFSPLIKEISVIGAGIDSRLGTVGVP